MPQIRKNSQPSLPSNKFLTSELPIAAFLKSRGLPLIDITKTSNGRITWVFELDGHDEAMLIHEYHTGGVVEAAKFFSELRNLKAMTYST